MRHLTLIFRYSLYYGYRLHSWREATMLLKPEEDLHYSLVDTFSFLACLQKLVYLRVIVSCQEVSSTAFFFPLLFYKDRSIDIEQSHAIVE